jgi:hypothetical protein
MDLHKPTIVDMYLSHFTLHIDILPLHSLTLKPCLQFSQNSRYAIQQI